MTPDLARCRVPLFSVLIWLLVIAAAPVLAGQTAVGPRLQVDAFITADGARLPLRAWGPADAPNAVIVAVHGFNDYSRFFDRPGRWLARRGIRSYAFDQRGFGGAPLRGRWAGAEVMAADLAALVRLLGQRHRGVPIHVLGHSMGAAVVMLFATKDTSPPHAGVILVAPAVWGRDTMPWYQVMALELAMWVMPGQVMTGKGLKITPSDNRRMLQELFLDPLVIKGARVEALYGVTNLMDRALAAAPRLPAPALILYGLRDEVIPVTPVERMIGRLPARPGYRVAKYERRYHMLLRDLRAEIVWRDILAWIGNRHRPLPSGADRGPLDPRG